MQFVTHINLKQCTPFSPDVVARYHIWMSATMIPVEYSDYLINTLSFESIIKIGW